MTPGLVPSLFASSPCAHLMCWKCVSVWVKSHHEVGFQTEKKVFTHWNTFSWLMLRVDQIRAIVFFICKYCITSSCAVVCESVTSGLIFHMLRTCRNSIRARLIFVWIPTKPPLFIQAAGHSRTFGSFCWFTTKKLSLSLELGQTKSF